MSVDAEPDDPVVSAAAHPTSCELFESGKLRDLETRLVRRFSPPLRPEHVQRCLVETVMRFEDAPVRAYLPVLIERAAITQLEASVLACSGQHQPSSHVH